MAQQIFLFKLKNTFLVDFLSSHIIARVRRVFRTIESLSLHNDNEFKIRWYKTKVSDSQRKIKSTDVQKLKWKYVKFFFVVYFSTSPDDCVLTTNVYLCVCCIHDYNFKQIVLVDGLEVTGQINNIIASNVVEVNKPLFYVHLNLIEKLIFIPNISKT